MQTIYKRFSVISGFLLLIFLLVANALVTRHKLSQQVENADWTVHTRQVLAELATIDGLVTDAETGQRGFLYTGRSEYLEPYRRAVAQVAAHLDTIDHLTVDNPAQQAHVPELRRLVQQKLAELKETLELYNTGHADQAKALVLTDAGLRTKERIRTVIHAMQQAEDDLLVSRDAEYRRSVRATAMSIYLATLVATAGLTLLAFYIVRQMALRERHAIQLRAREEWFRVTLTSIGEAVIATDHQGKVTFLNPLAERLIGTTLAKAVGRDIEDVFPIFNEYSHKRVENPVKRVIAESKIIGLANHTVLQSTNGVLTPIEDSAAPIWDDSDRLIGVVLVFRDATEGRRSQEVLRKTEKLAAAARLAATMAHEINNPLEAVWNLVYLSKSAPDVPQVVIEHLTLAEQELARVSHITRQTLGFYRESNVPDDVRMRDIIESVLTLYANKLKSKNISIFREFGECPALHGRSGELKQAVSNLIGNAADAVADRGSIWIRLSCSESPEGTQVHVTIEDDGPGIAEEHRNRIFEPFYTTKKDVGTGLGLWVTKEIVDRHGGTIHVSSRATATGAVFEIAIPVMRPAVLEEGMPADEPA